MKNKLLACLFVFLILFACVTPLPAHADGWTVLAWYGDPADLDDGWQLCDGTNGTPDLIDQFLVGAGSTYSIGDTGGAITTTLAHTHTVAAHTHSISSADLSHTHSVPAHTHSISSANLSHTHSISSADLSHTHSVPAHTHSISSANLDHVHTVYTHRHSIAQKSHTHTLEQVATLSSRATDRPIGVSSQDGYLHVVPTTAGTYTYGVVDDITTPDTHDHDGYTGYNGNVFSGYMDTNSTHDHGAATGSWNGTSGAMSANSTHSHGGATGAMSANSTHDHGAATGSWNGTSGAMSANSTHSHGGTTGSVSPVTDAKLSTVDLRPPYEAVYYICRSGVISYASPITASMLITDPLTTHYYTTTEGLTYSKVYSVSSGEETTNYLLIGVLALSVLQFIVSIITGSKRRWN